MFQTYSYFFYEDFKLPGLPLLHYLACGKEAKKRLRTILFNESGSISGSVPAKIDIAVVTLRTDVALIESDRVMRSGREKMACMPTGTRQPNPSAGIASITVFFLDSRRKKRPQLSLKPWNIFLRKSL